MLISIVIPLAAVVIVVTTVVSMLRLDAQADRAKFSRRSRAMAVPATQFGTGQFLLGSVLVLLVIAALA